MTDSMIERVAAAAQKVSVMGERPWDDLHPNLQKYWIDVARAAIEAMREPTEAMMQAAADAGAPKWYIVTSQRAMINAALSEEAK